MTSNLVAFRTGVVQPITCYRSGWSMIKDQYWLILGISFVGLVIGGAVPLAILMGPMMCGIYKCLLVKSRGEKASFGLLFKGFDHFLQSFIACLVMVVPTLLIMAPLYILMFVRMLALTKNGANQPIAPAQFFGAMIPIFVLMLAAVMILSLIFGVLLVFTFPLIVDRGLSALEALKTSARAALGNLGGLVGLVLLNMLLGLLGAMCCYVGAFFVMPLGFAAVLVAYQQVFGSEEPAPA